MRNSIKKVSLNILSATSLKSRHLVLMNGGILCKKHYINVRFFAEGDRPSYLPRKWKWINWSKYPRGQRHIRVIADRMLIDDCDYHVFMDDDSLTDIDKMISVIDPQNKKGEPIMWSAWPGRFFTPNWEQEFTKKCIDNNEIRNVREMWIGYEIAVINKKLAELSSGSNAAKKVLSFSDYLDVGTVGIPSPPDLQISMMAWLLKAKHINGLSSMCQQWPNYLNYSGLNKEGKLWHIHWIDKGIHVKVKDVEKIVSSRRYYNLESIFDSLFRNASKSFKASNYVDKPIQLGSYFSYWHAGEVEPMPLEGSPTIILRSNRVVEIINPAERVLDSLPAKWCSVKDGMKILWNNGMKSIFKWIYKDKIVGFDVLKNDYVSTTSLIIK